MDRVGALIHKLKEQYDQNVDKKSLLATLQLLLAELEQEPTINASKEKVSVILPKVHRIQQDVPSIETPVAETPKQVAVSEPLQPETVEEKTTPVAEQPAPPPVEDKPSLPETIRSYVLKPPTQAKIPSHEPKPKKEDPPPSLFDEVENIPTIAQHLPVKEAEPAPVTPEPAPASTFQTPPKEKEVYELNDVHIDGNSLNDKLKEEKAELASTLKGDPVHDLKRAVGINDRYRFINELFRGDEDMYERSIKTINAFATLAEAESWIQRELKVKIGWVETNHTVKDFDTVVKRRFS